MSKKAAKPAAAGSKGKGGAAQATAGKGPQGSAAASQHAADQTIGEAGTKPNPNKAKTADPREPESIPKDETLPIAQNVVMGTQGIGSTAPHHGAAHVPNARLVEEFEHVDDIDDEEKEPEKPKRTTRVKALQTGYYDDARRRAGDVFMIAPGDYSRKWMKYVSGDTPLKRTGPNASIAREHDAILGGKVRKALGIDNPLDAE